MVWSNARREKKTVCTSQQKIPKSITSHKQSSNTSSTQSSNPAYSHIQIPTTTTSDVPSPTPTSFEPNCQLYPMSHYQYILLKTYHHCQLDYLFNQSPALLQYLQHHCLYWINERKRNTKVDQNNINETDHTNIQKEQIPR